MGPWLISTRPDHATDRATPAEITNDDLPGPLMLHTDTGKENRLKMNSSEPEPETRAPHQGQGRQVIWVSTRSGRSLPDISENLLEPALPTCGLAWALLPRPALRPPPRALTRYSAVSASSSLFPAGHPPSAPAVFTICPAPATTRQGEAKTSSLGGRQATFRTNKPTGSWKKGVAAGPQGGRLSISCRTLISAAHSPTRRRPAAPASAGNTDLRSGRRRLRTSARPTAQGPLRCMLGATWKPGFRRLRRRSF